MSFCEDSGDVMVGVAEEAKLVGEGDARLEHVMGKNREIMDFDEDGMWGAEFVFDVVNRKSFILIPKTRFKGKTCI